MNLVDLYAGAGGWSHGWRMATGREPLLAVNHCEHAIHLHRLNHPGAEHHSRDIWQVDPAAAIKGRRVDWLHGSPDCTHFSRAKGGKPRKQRIRALAWAVAKWVRACLPAIVSLENVVEFQDWGPLDDAGHPIKARKGETFGRFVAQLRRLGYVVDWRVLCAADYGAPTIRKRLFLLARREGQPICWPAATHADPRQRDLFTGGLQPWRTAAECIDWSIPCKSIFERKKPLAPATCRRIAAGIVRYVLNGKPFIADVGMSGHSDFGPRRPDLVAAFLQQNFTGMVGKPLRVPVPTITARDHHSLVAATLLANNSNNAPKSVEEPLGTVTTGDRHFLVASFLTQYYSQGGTASRVDAPMPAVVSKARHGLVTVTIDGTDYVISDIGLRMLEPRELARAQGFPDSYVLEGTKSQQIARIGNSVVPQVAAALVRANIGREAAVA